MPKRRSAVKRLRVDKKRHLKNLKIKLQLKKTIKKFRELLSAKNTAEAQPLLKKVYSLLDKAAKKNIFHPNTVSRRKSRLTRSLSKVK
jgi:small subunit ribosomal protein S20